MFYQNYSYLDKFNSFCRNVTLGVTPVPKNIEHLVRLHLLELKRSENYLDYPYKFDNGTLTDVCTFYELFVIRAEEKNALVKLRSYSAFDYLNDKFKIPDLHIFILGVLYGWRYSHNDNRRFNLMYVLSKENNLFELDLLYAVINYYEYALKNSAKLGIISKDKGYKVIEFCSLYLKSGFDTQNLTFENLDESYSLLFDKKDVLTIYNDVRKDLLSRYKIIASKECLVIIHKDKSDVLERDLAEEVTEYLNKDVLQKQILIINLN